MFYMYFFGTLTNLLWYWQSVPAIFQRNNVIWVIMCTCQMYSFRKHWVQCLLIQYVVGNWLKCNMSDELQFKGNDPGAVRHGNFINYYQFNNVENRLKLLPTDLWNTETDQSFVCLDIGCNSGVNISLVIILALINAWIIWYGWCYGSRYFGACRMNNYAVGLWSLRGPSPPDCREQKIFSSAYTFQTQVILSTKRYTLSKLRLRVS
jgi:hypothetical protein